MKFRTTIPDEPTLGVTAVSGVTKTPGKTNDAEANLLGHDPGPRPATAVKDAEEVKGCAARCIKIQVDGDGIANGNPKKRAENYWGRDEK